MSKLLKSTYIEPSKLKVNFISMLSNFNKLNRKITPLAVRSMAAPSLNDEPKRVLVSGAAGQIAYSIVFRIAR